MGRKRELRALAVGEQAALERLSGGQKVAHQLVKRANAILCAYGGESGHAIAKSLGREPDTLYRWLNRFETQGIAGLADQPHSGRSTDYTEAEGGQIIMAARPIGNRLVIRWDIGHWTAYMPIFKRHTSLVFRGRNWHAF